jgi:alpha-1,2-mannosyltransferase
VNTRLSSRAYETAALAAAAVFAFTVVLSACVYYLYAPEVDFVSFWAAGRLALSGHAATAYDINAHRSVEETVTHIGGLMPFPYPPPFLFVVSAFAGPRYWLSYPLWMFATSGLYFAATRRLIAPRFAFAHPAAIVNAMIGQNGFLTSGIFLSGASALPRQPFAGGLILGLLAIKPQLGILLPVALLAGREWRAIGGAALSSLGLLALAVLAFGLDSYRGFFAITNQYAAFMVADRWNWAQQASVFGFFRFLHAAQGVAIAAQASSAVAAAAITWRAWSAGNEHKVAILAAATLLVPPYVFTYDSLLLIFPFSVLLQDRGHPWRAAVLWLCLLCPLLGYFGLYPGPNTIPVAAILSLWWLTESARAGAPCGAPFPAANLNSR